MPAASNACITVAKGGVGESGASSMVTHTVGGPSSKMIVLRNVNTSLCPNTGAIAVLVVDGVPVASGTITTAGNAIQTEAVSGAQVAAIVHAVPLFNGVVCVRLGELNYTLAECDLVNLRTSADGQRALLQQAGDTRDWYAWNNLMPPRPHDFHVIGEVETPTPGVDAQLVPKIPQGVNPRILLLDLLLVQQPGVWPQLVVWKQARYDKVNATYDTVQVFFGNQVIATVAVDTVQ